MNKSEANIRKHLAPLVGATVNVVADHHHVPRRILPQVRRELRHWGHELPKAVPSCEPDECGTDMVEVPSHAPIQLAADVMLIEQSIDVNGGRSFQTVAVSDFDALFGPLFVAGQPSAADFAALCDTPPKDKPPQWDAALDPITAQPRPWPPAKWCHGYCRYAAAWKAQGMLA